MLFSNISYLDENFEVVNNGYIQTKGKKITYIGQTKPKVDSSEEIYDGKNKFLTPAFVNNHSHVPMTLLRGYGEGLPLSRWLNEKVFPFEDNLTSEAVYAASLVGISEMIKSGCVSFSDMYFFCDDIANAVITSGVKINMCKGVTCFDGSGFIGSRDYNITKKLFDDFSNSNDGKIIVDACIHGEYTSNEKVVSEVAKFAKERGANVHIHLSETKSEHEECIKRHGMTPAAYFEKCGIFENNTTAAHCVHLSDNDFDILRKHKVNPVYCPSSNLKLGSGFANITKMIENGLNLTIGTDGASSNNKLNMLKEIQLGALVEKGRTQNPAILSNKELIKIATRNGAISQGRPNTGLIKQGYLADLVVFDLDKPNMLPCFDLLANVIFAAESEDIVLTMCDGEVIFKNGEYKTIDIEKAKFEMSKWAYDIAKITQNKK